MTKWLALAGAIILGPRKGKYTLKGAPRAIPGHNIPMASLGVFILWFAWFGFNAGSTTVGDGSIGRIAVTTNLSAAAGAVAAMITVWIAFKKPEATMSLNGALAGLVGITAGCNSVTPGGAIIIGLVAGVIVVTTTGSEQDDDREQRDRAKQTLGHETLPSSPRTTGIPSVAKRRVIRDEDPFPVASPGSEPPVDPLPHHPVGVLLPGQQPHHPEMADAPIPVA